MWTAGADAALRRMCESIVERPSTAELHVTDPRGSLFE